MDDALAPAFARRLAAYSAAAGVTLAAAPAAGAQVVHTDIDPDEVVTIGETVNLDFDDDGTVDFAFDGNAGGGTPTTARFWFRVPQGGNAQNGVLGMYAIYFTGLDIGGASRLSSGDVVGPAGPDRGFYNYGIVASLYNALPYYDFVGEEGFAGFRFVAGDGRRHYGWIRLAVSADVTEATLLEYAYESSPNTPVVAGATGVAVAPGPDGRPGTHALTEASPNPFSGRTELTLEVAEVQRVRLDVYNALGQRVATLHDGPLAAGAAHRFTLDGAGLASGVYVVRATGETFADARTLTRLR